MNPTPQTVLEMIDLNLGFGKGSPLLETPLTQILPAGQCTVLLGPNGVGKTTLLRTLAGLQPAHSGRVNYRGRPTDSIPIMERARQISYLESRPEFLPHIRVREWVALGRIPHTSWWGQLTKADDEKVDRALETGRLHELADRPLGHLSEGERQRAHLAQVLAQETEVLLLDEPTSFLDLPHRVEILHWLREQTRSHGLTLLLTSHDLDLALQLADQIWLLGPSGKFLSGHPCEILEHPLWAESFRTPWGEFDPKLGRFRLH